MKEKIGVVLLFLEKQCLGKALELKEEKSFYTVVGKNPFRF